MKTASAILHSFLVLVLLCGCGGKDAEIVDQARPVSPGGSAVAPAQDSIGPASGPGRMREVNVTAEPRDLLERAFAAAQRVESARMTFHRQERRGLIFGSLKPAEAMLAIYRESPFSVLFTWLSENSELTQCLYIEGENDGNVMLHSRKGILGRPGGVLAFPPELAVTFQKAKMPMTDFGPRRVMDRLWRRISDAEPLGGVEMTYVGRSVVGPANELCDHVTMVFPEGDAFAPKWVDLYLHSATHLPVMIEAWLVKKRVRDENSKLDARYIFQNTIVNPRIDDDEFQLDVLRDSANAG